MKPTFTFSIKKRFVLKSGLTIDELRQILHELEEEAAEAQADKFHFNSEKA